ncbi:MAG TPA: acetolactate synthase small subunit [Candidatus Dormibacteraeota bacterium]|nr:acetolactate synthase small subunit [Candidatus Dormibacteraeota bacterium]
MTPPAIAAPRLAPGTDGLTTTRHPGRIRLISIRIEDRRGVLQRVTNLLGRRGFGIETCAVGPSGEPGVVAISLRIDAGTQAHDQIVKQLNKLIDVVSVEDITDPSTVEWSTALIDLSSEEVGTTLAELPEGVGGQLVRRVGERAIAAISGPPGMVEKALAAVRLRSSSAWICSGPLALATAGAGGAGQDSARDSGEGSEP